MPAKSELSSNEVEAKLKEFEQKLKRLYRLYEQYFIGVEKMPPHVARKEVVRIMRDLEQTHIRNTAHKFRLRSLVQRFNSYKSYWNRTERQIEEGTYHRDQARAKQRKRRREARESEQAEQAEREVAGRADDGSIELEDLGEVDLAAMERELAEMDQRGEFERYVPTSKMRRDGFPEDEKGEAFKPAPRDGGEFRPAARESGGPRRPDGAGRQSGESGEFRPAPRRRDSGGGARADKLSEMQKKLGLSARGGDDERRRQKLEEMRRRLEADDGGGAARGSGGFDRANEGSTRKVTGGETPGAPTRGASYDKLRELREARRRIERQQRQQSSGEGRRPSSGGASGGSARQSTTGSNRVIRRSSSGGGSAGDNSREVYDKLIRAKRRLNEDTTGLNYDSVKRSMDRQRQNLTKKGAASVDFKVVVKDGKAFLKPEKK